MPTLLDTDPPAAAAVLAAWFAQRWPACEGLRVADLQAAPGGYSGRTATATLHWTTAGRSQTRAVVLRLPVEGDGVFPDAGLARQVQVMQALAGSDVPVPVVLGVEPDGALLGAPFYAMRRIAGRIPNENPLYHQQGWLHDLPEGQRAAHWDAGIRLLGALARVDWPARGLGTLMPIDGRGQLQAQLDAGAAHLRWTETLGRPYPALWAAHAWLVAHAPSGEPLVLQWGDAKLGNCIFDDAGHDLGRIAGALDWETAAIGPAPADLAWWLVHDEALSAGYGVPRLAGLPPRAHSIALWEQASGFAARHLEWHEVMAAWRFAIIMARIGTIFTQRGWVTAEARMDERNGAAAVLAERARRFGFAQPEGLP